MKKENNIEKQKITIHNKLHKLECQLDSAWDFHDDKRASRVYSKIAKLEKKLKELEENK